MSLCGKLHPAGRRCVGDHSASGSAARRMVMAKRLVGCRIAESAGLAASAYYRVAGRRMRRPATRRWLAVTRAGYTRAAGSATAAAPGFQKGAPTGTMVRPPTPLATPAAEAYQATRAVRMPT